MPSQERTCFRLSLRSSLFASGLDVSKKRLGFVDLLLTRDLEARVVRLISHSDTDQTALLEQRS